MTARSMTRWLVAAALVAGAAGNSLDVAGACSRARRSKDAIVWLGQRKHSTYDATHANTLNASMASVARFYPAFVNADVLVWHEGDLLERRDADALARVPDANVRWCLLNERTGWGPRADQRGAVAKDPRWAPGYLYMIRWYAVTCWDVLDGLGYAWAMRFDDDSFLLSPVAYDLFGAMRASKMTYGFRSISRECDRDFGAFVDGYAAERGLETPRDDGTIFCEKFPRHCAGGRAKHPKAPQFASSRPYCEGPGRLGFYNNWFVTSVAWWTSPPVAAFRAAFDDSALIFTHRNNDLIFQTAAVRLLLPRDRWRRFADFSYVHHTIREGDVRWGGLETGYADAGAAATLQAYLDAWHAGERLEGSARVAACDVQLTAGDGDFKRVSYVPHGKTRWGWLAAPYCNKNGRAPLW